MSKKTKREQYDELLQMREYDRNALLDHIKAIGMANVDDYKEWCKDNGFSVKLSTKGYGQFKKERDYLIGLSAEQTLRHQKQKTKSLPATLEWILKGEATREQVKHDQLFLKLYEIRTSPGSSPNLILSVLKVIERKTKFFNDLTKGRVIEKFGVQAGNTYLDAIVHLVSYNHKWLRSVEDWKPKSHNPHKQFISLVDHVLGKYQTPEFMYSAWFSNQLTPNPREFFIHLAQGGSVRKAPGLQVEFTKKQAHYFTKAPKWYEIYDAVKWAQVIGIGGDHRLAEAILATKIGQGNYITEFWMTVVQWLVNNPMLDPAQIGPIADYIHNQKYSEQRVWVENGVLERRPPPQPDFNMKGRTAEALLRHVQEWHGLLRREKKGGNYTWDRSTIPEFEQTEGSSENKNLRIWSIKELCSSKELQDEGRSMKHCVSSYASSCASGRVTIWSLTLDEGGGTERRLTIEVTTANKMVVQVRGKMNRSPEPVESRIVSAWATQAGLGVSSYSRLGY